MNSFEPDRNDESLDALLAEFFDAEMPDDVRAGIAPPLLRITPAPQMNREPAASPRVNRATWTPWIAGIGLSAAAVAALAFVSMRGGNVEVAQQQEPKQGEVATVEPSAPRSAALVARLEEQPSQERFENSPPPPKVERDDPRTHVAASMGGSDLAALLNFSANGRGRSGTDRSGYGYRVSEAYKPVVSTPNTHRRPLEQRARVRTTNVSFFEPQSGSQVELQLPELEIEILAVRDRGK
jgi:hypothetical protein